MDFNNDKAKANSRRRNLLLAVLTSFLLGAVISAWLYFSIQSRDLPEPGFWQDPARLQPALAELDAADIDSFAGYLRHEQSLFAGLDQLVREQGRTEPAVSRFHPAGPRNPVRFEPNWNRTTENPVRNPLGAVVLVHGLSDSPYSLRTLAELFNQAGYYTLTLRLPGHGTAPGMLLATDLEQFRAAVRVGVRHAVEQVGADKPLLLVGYSNGAPLVVDYSLTQLEGGTDPVPQKLVLLSPALAVNPGAEWAFLRAALGRLPGLGKAGWISVQPELDPFKYASFPAHAGQQLVALNESIQQRLTQLPDTARPRFPAILALVSVADATVPAGAVASHLLEQLPAAGSELVVFDINRRHEMQWLIKGETLAWLDTLRNRDGLPFALSILTNLSDASSQVQELRRDAGAPATGWQVSEQDGRWPPQVYSLSHIALPFRADDPFYGDDGSQLERLANLALRGEKNLFVLPPEQLMRLRYNPFSEYLQQKILVWVKQPSAQ